MIMMKFVDDDDDEDDDDDDDDVDEPWQSWKMVCHLNAICPKTGSKVYAFHL